jgi:ABC-type Zn uptake system ZnuABC Zn-binding protein ZnuA
VIGYGLDDWAARTVRGADVTHIVPVDNCITLRRFSEASSDAGPQAVDPHYWLSIANGMMIARTVAAEIERLVPERRDQVERALAEYVMKLAAADSWIRCSSGVCEVSWSTSMSHQGFYVALQAQQARP